MLFADPVNNPFNNWLRNNGVWVAVGVAAALLIIIGVLVLLSKIRKHRLISAFIVRTNGL